MASRQQNTTGSFAFSNDMAGRRSAQYSILTNQKLLYAVCRTDLSYQLDDFWVPIPAVTTYNEETALVTFRNRQ